MAGQVKLLAPPLSEADAPDEIALAPPSPAMGVPNAFEQVRELLYGDAMRQQGRRVEDVQGALNDFEQRVLHRFDEVQASIDTITRLLRQEQAGAMRAIGGAIVEMGRQIAAMGEIRDRNTDRN